MQIIKGKYGDNQFRLDYINDEEKQFHSK
jgi:hypothetical protein